MRGLLLFHFRYRWRHLLFWSLLGGFFILSFCAQGVGKGMLMLCITFAYADLPDRYGSKKTEAESLPRLALPFSKAEYVLYVAVRTLAYYAGCAVFAGIGLGIGYLVNPRTAEVLALIPFMIVFFAGFQGIALVVDCLSGFRFGRLVALPLIIFAVVQGESFGSALARADSTGILEVTRSAFGLFVSEAARNPGPAVFAALAASGASVLFAVLYARKIRF